MGVDLVSSGCAYCDVGWVDCPVEEICAKDLCDLLGARLPG